MSTLRVKTLANLDNSFSINVEDIYSESAATVGSWIELRNKVPDAAGQRVTLTGWNSGSQNGGGIFVAVLVSGTDDGGTIASNGGSYYWRRVGVTEVTPQMFGATSSGTTSDLAAFQAMALSGYPVFIPAGSYFIDGVWGSAGSTQGIQIRGAGDRTQLLCGTDARLRLVGDGASIRNVWFRAQAAGISSYIDIGDSTAAIETTGATVENCLFGDEQTTYYASNYIRCYNLWASTIRGNHFRGIGNTTNTITAISAYYSVNNSCTENSFVYMGTCIKWNSTVSPGTLANVNEGWLIANNTAAAIYGFFSATNGLAPQIENNIIDIVYGPNAIYTDAGSSLINNNWIAAQGIVSQAALIYLTGGDSMIRGNRMVGQSNTVVMIQIAGSGSHIQIQDNNIFQGQTGVSVASAMSYMTFSGNNVYSQTVRSWDLSNVSYLTYYGNLFRDSNGATYPLGLLPATGSNLVKRTWATTVTATLSAGTSSQDFTVTLPTGIFSGVPLCQVSLASGASGLVVVYLYDSSSATTATIRVINPAGTAIPSATYRVCLTFTDQTY